MDDLETIRLQPDKSECPCRLDVFLAQHLPDISRSRLQDLIRQGAVRVDGASVKPGYKIMEGQAIEIALPEPIAAAPAPEDIPLDILYEDGDLLVINKPAGMVVHPGAGISSGTLVNALLYHCKDLSGIGGVLRPGIVHRLDKLTSGCLCAAKNDFAHQKLAAQLENRSMSRIYWTWVSGEMANSEGRISAPIGRSYANPTRMAVVRHGGREAATNWKVTARIPGLTRLECRLETGRTHQIRVHLSHIGHPVLGDPEYGIAAKEAKLLVPPGFPLIIQAVSRCRRQMLHAYQIHFIHPRSGEMMEYTAPLPEDMASFEAAVAPFLM